MAIRGDRSGTISHSPLWWIGAAALCVVVACGLGYFRWLRDGAPVSEKELAPDRAAEGVSVQAGIEVSPFGAEEFNPWVESPDKWGFEELEGETGATAGGEAIGGEWMAARVRVVNKGGAPVAGAIVRAIQWLTQIAIGQTDEAGNVSIPRLPPNTPIDVAVAKDGFKSETKTLPPRAAGKNAAETTIVLTSRSEAAVGAFAGTVRNASGEPIAGAVVKYAPPTEDEGESYDTTTSGVDGRYRLDVANVKLGLGSAEMRPALSAVSAGYAQTFQYPASPGTPREPLPVDFALGKARWIELRLLDPAGGPIEGAAAELIQQLPGFKRVQANRRAQSGVNGIVRFDGLPDAPAKIGVTKQGYYSAGFSNVAANTRMDALLTPRDLVRGKVVDVRTGEAIEQFKVFVGNFQYPRKGEPMEHFRNGEFALQAGSGGTTKYIEPSKSMQWAPLVTAEISIQATGYSLLKKSLTPDASGSGAPTLFELIPADPHRGQIVSAIDGQPVAGAKVRYLLSKSGAMGTEIYVKWNDFSKFRNAPGFLETETNARGEFSLSLPALDVASPAPATRRSKAPPSIPGLFMVEAPGLARMTISATEWPGLPASGDGARTITLKPESSITVSAIRNTAPAAGVSVVLRLTPEMRSYVNEEDPNITDERGIHTWSGLHAGKYRIETRFANSVEALTLSESVQLGEGESRLVMVSDQLGDGSLSGRVYDLDGRPVHGIVVRLESEGRPGMSRLTNHRGEYAFDRIAGGKYKMHAYRNDEARGLWEFGQTEVEVVEGREAGLDFHEQRAAAPSDGQ